ncbi:hypothetical protein OF829_08660 [Sphingomonas sp. LB-2]|uniref:hypothetical protein n=1 Tax=Sphingomonas caeni TaxID=2984949 RepID=UPI00222EE35D|nr:hypothetical protein [Sphingomonas caeni]MCW3847311.1 hypothetical protein [Sphingomonas caeni]
MAFDDPILTKITDFLDRIGVPVVIERVADDSFLPGVTVWRGTLAFDPEHLPYPGDLLHEAGHIAVTDPAVRNTLDTVSDNPAEEMAAIAWSYAAALEIGIDPAVVFHEHGYRGGGAYLIPALSDGCGPGVPMLAYYGMTAEAKWAEARGMAPYPAMARWLR